MNKCNVTNVWKQLEFESLSPGVLCLILYKNSSKFLSTARIVVYTNIICETTLISAMENKYCLFVYLLLFIIYAFFISMCTLCSSTCTGIVACHTTLLVYLYLRRCMHACMYLGMCVCVLLYCSCLSLPIIPGCTSSRHFGDIQFQLWCRHFVSIVSTIGLSPYAPRNYRISAVLRFWYIGATKQKSVFRAFSQLLVPFI
jgi:hypothetical protein